MRIIGGKHRGRSIIAPKDAGTTRPITDRVKETLFNRLMSLGYLGSGNVLDIFAGTGSLGLEALSRGGEHCTFVERDRDGAQRLKQNIDDFEFADCSKLLTVDAYASGWLLMLPRRPIDLAFVDPPYRDLYDEEGRARVGRLLGALREHMADGGLCILRSEQHTKAPPTDDWDGPVDVPVGTQVLHFYQAGEPG